MIWLASYPRSGNTFFRTVLYYVYGVESSTFHTDPECRIIADYDKYPVVKTHQLPGELVPADPDIPAVYIVRDGRDCLVSMAHQRKDMVAPDSDYETNLRDVILAPRGTHFGGWSRNVREWLERADIVIRFEDLIADPIGCVERIRPIIDLPEPKVEELPTFEDLRTREFKYEGIRKSAPEEEKEFRREKFYRKGKVGSWREDMPEELHELFWEMHGDGMEALGYTDGRPAKIRKRSRSFYPRWFLDKIMRRLTS
jgi:hypothetical protein